MLAVVALVTLILLIPLAASKIPKDEEGEFLTCVSCGNPRYTLLKRPQVNHDAYKYCNLSDNHSVTYFFGCADCFGKEVINYMVLYCGRGLPKDWS